ncbi:hypothetical protein ACJX0J_022498 [Zea mays]
MSKENKATSHTPLIDHHYKTYHHMQFQIQVYTRELLNEKKLYSAQINKRRDMEKIAKEGEKKGGTKGKIVTDYASCIIHYIKQAETWQNMLNSIILMNQDRAHCNMLVTQAFFCEIDGGQT